MLIFAGTLALPKIFAASPCDFPSTCDLSVIRRTVTPRAFAAFRRWVEEKSQNFGFVLINTQNSILAPVWFEEKLANGSAAAGVQMDGLTTMIAANGFNRAAKAFIMY